MWRGGFRQNISVAASFVWRCLNGSTMAPFPHPAHRTGQADFPHPALGQDFTPSLSRATPSAVSEHSSEFIGCPISWSFTTYCVCLELRSLQPLRYLHDCPDCFRLERVAGWGLHPLERFPGGLSRFPPIGDFQT